MLLCLAESLSVVWRLFGAARAEAAQTPPHPWLFPGRLHAKGYTLAHHLQSGSPGRSAHGGGTPGPGQPAVTRLSA